MSIKALKAIYYPARLLAVMPIITILFFIDAGYGVGASIGALILGVFDYYFLIRGKDESEWGYKKEYSVADFFRPMPKVFAILILFDLIIGYLSYLGSSGDTKMAQYVTIRLGVMILCNIGGYVWSYVGIKKMTA